MEMYTAAMRIDSNVAIHGELKLIQKLPPQFKAMFAAESKDATNAFADQCLGPFLSHKGSFAFEKDQPHEWLAEINVSDPQYIKETEPLRWAARRLGSIELVKYALFYTEDKFYGFWIETRERGQIRVLASELNHEHFEALPAGFRFTPPWLVKAIVDLY